MSRTSSFLLVVLLTLSCLATHVLADPDFPVTVYVSLIFNSIAKVDGVEQSFAADFYMSHYWIDDNFNDTEPWDPVVEFQNSQGDVTEQYDHVIMPVSVTQAQIGSPVAGHSWYGVDQRYVGNFNTRLLLNDFPFDEQDVVLALESSIFTNDFVVFKGIVGLDKLLLPDGIQVIEWSVIGTSVNSTSNYYANFDQTYSRLEVRVHLTRQSGYYVWKIFLGSILLVIMAIAIFALKIDEPDRMMGTITIFLALISFLFVAGSSIPKVAYQTRLDNFMNFSFFMVFFILLAHGGIYAVRLALPERINKPYKIKRSGEASRESVGEKSSQMEVSSGSPDGFEGFDKVPVSRKLDFICIILFSIIYIIGVPSILYGPTSSQP